MEAPGWQRTCCNEVRSGFVRHETVDAAGGDLLLRGQIPLQGNKGGDPGRKDLLEPPLAVFPLLALFWIYEWVLPKHDIAGNYPVAVAGKSMPVIKLVCKPFQR
jgi:hypothetical protein